MVLANIFKFTIIFMYVYVILYMYTFIITLLLPFYHMFLWHMF